MFQHRFPVLGLLLFYTWRIVQGGGFDPEIYVGAIVLVSLLIVRWIVVRQKQRMMHENLNTSNTLKMQNVIQRTKEYAEGFSNE
jgi:hypothetical protein